ncbi:MAG TPA: kelch repeat-containing protein [Tepidisphaeraceae bacterium]|jgi:N-acetylneuraminic acid mutarotase
MFRAAPIVCLFISLGCTPRAVVWSSLPALPDPRGLAGGFAGVSGGAVIFAGGSNFPDGPPWEGGRKAWYDGVYTLDVSGGCWWLVGSLPGPRGYGASVSYRGAVICIGGGDARRNVPDVTRLRLDGSHLTVMSLPPLPVALANCCAAVVEDELYVACGQQSPDSTEASRDAYRISLARPDARWECIAPPPGPARILATAASCDGAFWVIGGASLARGPDGKPVRRYLADVYRFDPAANRWTRVADLPMPLAASPTPAPTIGQNLYLLGGDDGTAVGVAPPQRHPGFNRRTLCYDVRRNRWSDAGAVPVAQVTTPAFQWQGSWIVCSGEVRPGTRSPAGWAYALRP